MIWTMILFSLFLFQSSDGPEFPGQPLQCDNYKTTAHKCECGRAMQDCEGKMPQGPVDVTMDKKCSTYCRKQHCLCAGHGCRS